jgi:hypothetical protein
MQQLFTARFAVNNTMIHRKILGNGEQLREMAALADVEAWDQQDAQTAALTGYLQWNIRLTRAARTIALVDIETGIASRQN